MHGLPRCPALVSNTMLAFMNIALCPFNPTVGALAANAARIRALIESIRPGEADLIALPELAMCGYPPRDLLLQHGFVEECQKRCREIQDGVPQVASAIGLPIRLASGGIANGLRIRLPSGQAFEYHKRLLPTYDVFDEDRYFEPGSSPLVITIAGTKVGFSICEDLWRGHDAGFASHYANVSDPVADLVALGARVIVSPSASPFVLGKNNRHRDIVRGHAMRHGITVASVNQAGANDELIFDGHAFSYGADGLLKCNVHPFGSEEVVFAVDSAGELQVDPPRAPEADLFDALVLGIHDYLAKVGFRGCLIGLSGGIDSALTAVLAHCALRRRPDSTGVVGVAMPSRYSSDHSVEDALELARNLGITCHVVPIQESVEGARTMADGVFATMGVPKLGQTLPDLAEENLQSRLRGTLLMTLSNRTGSIVLTTGNKSEMAVGYCTLYGDMNGGLAVLSDVTKMWVYRLSRWINANCEQLGYAVPPIPQRTIDKAPSAELRPDQKDQDSLPPYEVLDAIIEKYVEGRCEPAEIIAAGFDAATVQRVVRLIDLSEYKRKQAAIGLKVSSVAFGSGRRFPIAWKR
jgi:NAD+ synthase (glutamine-hydrolysing)